MDQPCVSIINDGDYAILQKGQINQLFQISKRKNVFVNKNKMKLCMTHIIGHPYGSLFEIKGKDLQIVKETTIDLSVNIETSALDNRNLIDDGKSQLLTKDEIEALKSEGASSGTIVKSLVENSSTFNNKTHYSQEKYVKKKKEKYSNLVRILKPNIRLLSELYHSHGPPKICNLRIDVLSQMLGATNVMANGCYLVVDSCLGLLVAAVLDRILPGGQGKVVHIYMEPGPVSSYRQALEAMNFNKEDLKEILFGISYQTLFQKQEKSEASNEIISLENDINGSGSSDKLSSCPTESLNTNQQEAMDFEEIGNVEGTVNKEEMCFREPEKKKAKMSRKILRQAETEKALNIMKTKNLDSLLVCCREVPGPVAVALLDYLAPSRPFAIHSMTLQPLVETYDLIKSSNKAIFLKLTESWFRKYQVLPNRTHPEVYMSNTSGYLLTGIKVEPVCK